MYRAALAYCLMWRRAWLAHTTVPATATIACASCVCSYVCSQTDPKAWGPDPLKFDPYGNADKLWGGNAIFNGFNSVGDKGERICPGRELALEMAIDFMQAIHAKPGSSSVVQKPSQKPGSRFNSFKGKKPR